MSYELFAKKLENLRNELDWRISRHSPDESQTVLVFDRHTELSDLNEMERHYLTMRAKRQPYELTTAANNQDGEKRFISRIGFFTNHGLEVASLIDDRDGTIRLGLIPESRDITQTDENFPLIYRVDDLSVTGLRIPKKIAERFLSKLYEQLQREPQFVIGIWDHLRNFPQYLG